MQRGAASPPRGQWFTPKPTSINGPVVPIFVEVQPGQSAWPTLVLSRGTGPSQHQPRRKGHDGVEPMQHLDHGTEQRSVQCREAPATST